MVGPGPDGSPHSSGIESQTSAPPSGRLPAETEPPWALATTSAIGKPQPGARPRARLLGPAEALERARRGTPAGSLGRRPRRAAPRHRRPSAPRDARSRRRAERVLDEIAQRLLQPQRVGRDVQLVRRRRPRARGPPRCGPGAEASGHRRQQVRRPRQPCAGGVGDRRRRARARAGPPRAERAGRSRRRPSERTARAPLAVRGRLSASSSSACEQRERRSQLVARLGDEAPLTLERRLEPVEHRVQRLAEPRDLVVARGGSGSRRPGSAAEIAAASAPHRLDRAQRGRRQHVAEQRRQHERDRAPRRASSREQPVERLVALLERGAHDERRTPRRPGSPSTRAPPSKSAHRVELAGGSLARGRARLRRRARARGSGRDRAASRRRREPSRPEHLDEALVVVAELPSGSPSAAALEQRHERRAVRASSARRRSASSSVDAEPDVEERRPSRRARAPSRA